MASRPITSGEIDGETVETVSDFILGGSRITADGDCSHEIKRRLLLGRKVMTNLYSILKSRDITLPTKICLNKSMVFPVVMYGYESWTIKVEHKKIEAFEFLFTFCHKGGVICISEVMILLLAILIPACASSSPAFLMM